MKTNFTSIRLYSISRSWLFKLPIFAFLFFYSFQLYAQCTPTLVMALGNGDDGESIAFNPNDGLIYHLSGIDDGEEFFEAVDPIGMTVGPNLVPGDSYPDPPVEDEFSGLVWYPPLNAFIGMDRDEDIYSITTTGTFTELSTFAGSSGHGYLRGFAVVGTTIYGVDAASDELISFDINTGAILTNTSLTVGGVPINGGNGLATQPVTGNVYIIFKNGGPRRLGIVDIATGEITDLGSLGDNFAGITFDNSGNLYLIAGDGASDSETLFFLEAGGGCVGALPSTVPTLSEWGLILLALLLMNYAVILLMGAQKARKQAIA